jgi:CheY-like chemotaxis protein
VEGIAIEKPAPAKGSARLVWLREDWKNVGAASPYGTQKADLTGQSDQYWTWRCQISFVFAKLPCLCVPERRFWALLSWRVSQFPSVSRRQDRKGTDCMEEMVVILVVEDEAIIRMEAVQMLEAAGFAVIEAFNAHDAMKLLENRADVRAVFTDINMPGRWDGMQLARMIKDRWPPIHLVVTSGLISPDTNDLPPRGRFIRKPYHPAQVVATLRELLGQIPSSDPVNHARRAA